MKPDDEIQAELIKSEIIVTEVISSDVIKALESSDVAIMPLDESGVWL